VIELFKALAVRGQWLVWPSLAVFIGCAAVFGYATFTENAPDQYLTGAITGATWALLVFVFVRLFPYAPDVAPPEATRWQRFKRFFARLWYGLLALAVIVTSFFVIWLTIRMV